MVRAAFFIHRIIQVTKATATIDSVPPNSSCSSNVMFREVKVMTAQRPMLTATAAATPAHTNRSWSRCPVLTR